MPSCSRRRRARRIGLYAWRRSRPRPPLIAIDCADRWPVVEGALVVFVCCTGDCSARDCCCERDGTLPGAWPAAASASASKAALFVELILLGVTERPPEMQKGDMS